jgi:hypothetical protein
MPVQTVRVIQDLGWEVLMGQRVSPVFGMVDLGWFRSLGGPIVTSECGGHIAR